MRWGQQRTTTTQTRHREGQQQAHTAAHTHAHALNTRMQAGEGVVHTQAPHTQHTQAQVHQCKVVVAERNGVMVRVVVIEGKGE